MCRLYEHHFFGPHPMMGCCCGPSGWHRPTEEQRLELLQAIQQAAFIRLRPILMTELVGIIGLLPLALGLGEGTELLKPMAVAVIGGLVFGLLLVFLFLPALYLIFAREKSLQQKTI